MCGSAELLSLERGIPGFLFYNIESFTISTINFSIHGSNKRFVDKLYEGSRPDETSIYVLKIII